MIYRNFIIEEQPDEDHIHYTKVYKFPNGGRATGGSGAVQEDDILNVDNLSLADNFRIKVRELGKERWEARNILMTDSIDGVIKSIKDGTSV